MSFPKRAREKSAEKSQEITVEENSFGASMGISEQPRRFPAFSGCFFFRPATKFTALHWRKINLD
jgi:hypothetical protein